MNTGEMIAQLRKYRGLTQLGLAQKLGLSKQRVNAMENSEDVSFSTMQRICAALEFEIMAFPMESRPDKLPADIILSDPG